MSISWIRIQVNGGTTLYRTSFFKHQTNSNVLFVGEPTFIIWPLAIFSHIEKVKAALTTWFMTWMYRFFSTLKNAFRQQNTNRNKSLRLSVEEEKNCLFPSNACFAAKYWYNILSFFSAQKRALLAFNEGCFVQCLVEWQKELFIH